MIKDGGNELAMSWGRDVIDDGDGDGVTIGTRWRSSMRDKASV